MNLVLFGLFVLLLVAIQFAGGKTVDEIIERYIRAMGGSGKFNAIKSIYSEGMITMKGSTLSIKIYQFKENIASENFTIQWQISDIADNQYETLQSPASTQLLDKNSIECITQFNNTAHLINYIADDNKILLIGKEVVDENICYRIALKTKAGIEINYWFKKSDGLLYQTAIKNNENGLSKTMNISTKYAEYRAVQNIFLTHLVEIILPGTPTIIKVNINKIIINEPIEVNFVNTYN